jgi:hypothetical protein
MVLVYTVPVTYAAPQDALGALCMQRVLKQDPWCWNTDFEKTTGRRLVCLAYACVDADETSGCRSEVTVVASIVLRHYMRFVQLIA